MKDSEQVLLEQNSSNLSQSSLNLSWFERTFSRMQKDSLRGGIFTMLITALGTGMFTLHHVYSDLGIVWSILMFAMFGLNYIMSARFLTNAAVKVGQKCKSLNELVEHYLGPKFLLFYNIIFFLYSLIALISLVLAITKTFYKNFEQAIWNILSKLFTIPDEARNYAHFNTYAVWVVGFFAFFLTIQKGAESLRYFSLLSFGIIVGIVIVCIIQCPARYEHNKEGNTLNFFDISFQSFVSRFGLAVYSFNCITNYYGAYSSIRNPTEIRVNKVFTRTFVTLFALFVFYGLASYISLGQKYSADTDLFIFRPKFDDNDNDIMMTIFRALLTICLFVGFAVNVFPLKTMTYGILKVESTWFINFITSLFYTVVPVLIAGFFTEVTDYANLGGCFCAMMLAFVVPGLIAVYCDYFETRKLRLVLIYWIMTMIALMVAGTVVAILAFYSKKK